jgi:hypothetical protein
MRQLGVAAFGNGTTITCKLRLDLTHSCSPECDIYYRRVNEAGIIGFLNRQTQ